MSTERIKVAIRIRPFLPNEISSNKAINLIPEDENTLILYKDSQKFQGTFNQIFSDDSTQKEVFNFIKPCIYSIKAGINCTILAYGQTGTGKTYTMFGGDWSYNEDNYDSNNCLLKIENKNEKDSLLKNQIIIDKNNECNGIIPNLIMELYHLFNKNKNEKENNENNNEKENNENNNDKENNENNNDTLITCSYIQIYNEKIYDLLDFSSSYELSSNSENKLSSLKLKSDKKQGLIIEGANEVNVPSYSDIFDILETGESNRKIRQTNKNYMSSRSHTIFMINIFDKNSQSISKIKLCDLAGSERYNNSDIYEKEHIYEMKNINKSLFTLGNVINALAQKKKYIPYKDSKLTRILEDSLRGNSSIYLIATISPNEKNVDETFNTLKFADRAHNVMINITPNKMGFYTGKVSSNTDRINYKEIEKLKGEITGLKKLIYLRACRNNLPDELISLKIENNKLKKSLEKINNINAFNTIINENKKLKRELSELKADYMNLKSKLLLNKKDKNNKNILFPNKKMKNSISQENIFQNNIFDIKKRIYTIDDKKLLKKLENNTRYSIDKLYNDFNTDDINKMNGEKINEKFKFKGIQNKKPKLKHINNRINILNSNSINKPKFLIKKEFKSNKIILSSLKRLQLLNYLEEKRDNFIKEILNQ